ncbi:MAG: hypothetical protein A2Y81_08500 [Nitrospirae bacterium RBG_13_43_8]|nr:MAG: hypothetical protein A2Y81_08500 [Nitrospirae bacterium RBG_13_43_8]
MKDKKKLTVPQPQIPCEKCAEAALVIKDAIIIYCEHNRSGAVMLGSMWHVFYPILQPEFESLIVRMSEHLAEALKKKKLKTFGKPVTFN